MRCHSQAITIKLTKDVPLEEIEQTIANYNEWSQLVPNTKEETLKHLSPASVRSPVYLRTKHTRTYWYINT